MLIQLYSVLHMQRYKKYPTDLTVFKIFAVFRFSQIYWISQISWISQIIQYSLIFTITKPVRNILLPRTSAYYKDINMI